MFKAKLIENERYYKLRGKQALLMLLPSFFIGIIVNFYQIPFWITSLVVVFYLLTAFLIRKNQKAMEFLVGDKFLEIDEQEIRIVSKKKTPNEIINLGNFNKIIIPQQGYSIPQETIKEVGKEITGTTKKNYLILRNDNQERKFDFEIESYYMIKQLEKLIKNWSTKGYEIENINQLLPKK